MANSFFVPFNQNPDSVDRKNADYTIPSGKYAKLRRASQQAYPASEIQDFSVRIDGDIWIPQLTYRIDDYSNVDAAVTFTCTGTLYVAGSSTSLQITNVMGDTSFSFNLTATNTWENYPIQAGDSITLTAGSGVDWTAYIVPAVSIPDEIWAPAGTAITTDGGEYWVELYNEYS